MLYVPKIGQMGERMPARKITEKERIDALRKGQQEGQLRFPGRRVSVQVEGMTDERGNDIYKVLPVASE
jgi:hypothetical protein